MQKINLGTTILAVIITAVIIGGVGVYFVQQSQLDALNQQLDEIAEQIKKMDENEAVVEETKDQGNVYGWEAQGITFNYPDGYNVLERNDGSLYITTATELPDGDISVFWTLLEIDSSTSLAERIAEYSEEETFSQETKQIGDHEFTKVSLYANFGGFNYARYLLEFDGKLLDYKAGKNEGDLAFEVLESIQF